MKERTNTSNTKGLVIATGIVVVVGLTVVLSGRGVDTNTVVPVPTATSSAPTVEDIFSQPPIIPEAKVSTEGWKTCRNEEYGYEFKFPAEWHIYGEDAYSEATYKPMLEQESEQCNGPAVILTTIDLIANTSGITSQHEGFYMYSTPLGTTTEEIYWDKYVTEQKIKQSMLRYLLVDGSDAVLQVFDAEVYKDEGWWLTAVHGGVNYRLSGSLYKQQSATIETILSTFRFLNKESTSTEVEAQ